MSKISKALKKYKKERNLTSAQILNLDDAKATEPALKEGEDRSAREGVDADAGKTAGTASSATKREHRFQGDCFT